MGCYKLVAIGEDAKKLAMCDGGADLLLWQSSKPILLGRAVKEGDGYKYPNQWNSLSSRHCNLQYQTTQSGQVRVCRQAVLCRMLPLLLYPLAGVHPQLLKHITHTPLFAPT